MPPPSSTDSAVIHDASGAIAAHSTPSTLIAILPLFPGVAALECHCLRGSQPWREAMHALLLLLPLQNGREHLGRE